MTTGFDVFDRTLHKTFCWLDEIASDLSVDRHRAYGALRAVLHALRDRLTTIEAAELAAQMPMLIRGMYFEGWSQGRQSRIKRIEELVENVKRELAPDASFDYAREAVAAVFRTLDRHISSGELTDVRQCLPKALRDAWPTH